MRRVLTVGIVASALVVLAAVPVARADTPPRFNRTARLDASQVVDTRDFRGVMICPDDVTAGDDDSWLRCTVDLHPITKG